jgi:hypothetical protein
MNLNVALLALLLAVVWGQANEENEENDFTFGTRPGTRRTFFARNRVGVDDDDDEEAGCVVVVGAVI